MTNDEKKLEKIEVRVSSQEKDALRRKAQKQNKSISQVVRDSAIRDIR